MDEELRCDPLDKEDMVAIKAVAAGEGNEYQQKRVLHLIVKNFSRSTDLTYIPGSPGGSTFLAGRAFVGHQLLKYINVPIEELSNE